MPPVRVLLVDSSDDFLDGLAAWLGEWSAVEVLGRANTGLEAIDLVDRLGPDLVVMDVSMPRMNGLEATREIKAAPGGPRVVLTTFHASEAARAEARSAGADELIAKSEVTTKLRALIDGSTPAPPAPDAPDAPTGSPKKPKPGKGFLSQ